MLRKERKWSHIEISVKTTKGRKRVQDKNKEQKTKKKKKKEMKNKGNKQKTVMDKVDINPIRSITTLNIIALKALIKRPEIVRVDEKIRPHHMLSR